MDDANELVLDGNEIVYMKMVRNENEIDTDKYFHPDMCHQVFGQSETVYGYKNLKIKLVYDASNFICYVSSSYDHKVKPDPVSGLEPDDYMEKLKAWLPEDYVTSKEEFVKKVAEKKGTKPFGEIITEFKVNKREFEVRLVDATVEGYEELHQRMETLIVWYIDAANFIDLSDTKWRYYIVYEKVQKIDEEFEYYALGYATVYEYFAFPDKHRYRISQFIIFPPYQNLGLGTELLKGIYKNIKTLPNVQDITVEEPSEKFQSLRDLVDIELCENLKCFDPKILKNDFNRSMITEVKETLKLNDKQIRRIYEILRLSVTDEGKDFLKYEAMIKHRLSAPFTRHERGGKRRKLFNNSHIEVDQQKLEHQESLIEKQCSELLECYKHVLLKHKSKNCFK